MAEVVDIAYRAKLDDLRAELAKLPGISDKEAKKMVNGLDRQLRRAEKAAKRAAKKMKKDSDKISKGLEGAKQAAEGFQGQLGGGAGVIEKFGRSIIEINAAAGPFAAGMVAGGLALAGVGFVAFEASGRLISFIEDAAAGAETLRGPFAAGTDGATDSIGVFTDKLEGSRQAGTRLQVLLAGDLASSFDGMLDVATGVAGRLEGLVGVMVALEAQSEKVRAITFAVTSVLSLGAVNLAAYATGLGSVEEEGAELNRVLTEQIAIEERAKKQREAELDLRKAVAEAARQNAADRDKIARKEEARRRAVTAEIGKRFAATERLAALERAAIVEGLSDQDKLIAASDLRIEALDKLEQTSKEAGAADGARIAETARLSRQLAALDAERLKVEQDAAAKSQAAMEATLAQLDTMRDSFTTTLDAAAQAWRQAVAETVATAAELAGTVTSTVLDTLQSLKAAQIDAASEAIDRQLDGLDKLKAKRSDLQAAVLSAETKIESAQASAQANALKSEITNSKTRIKNRRGEAMQLAKQEKALRVAGSDAAAIEALVKSVAILGPPVPPNFAGIAGFASAGVIGAAQSAEARRAPLPEFHVGTGRRGTADEVEALLTRDQTVNTARGTAAAGGPAAVADRNNTGRGGPSIVNQIIVGRRVIAQAVAEAFESDASVGRALDERTRTVMGQVPIFSGA